MADVNELLDLEKCKIKFTTYEGEYEGVVHVVSPANQKVMIDKAFFFPQGEEKVFMGTLVFQCHEITSYIVLSRPGKEINVLGTNRQFLSNSPVHDAVAFTDDDESDILSEACVQEFTDKEEYILKIPENQDKVPLDTSVIDCIDDEFHQAIVHIKKEGSIGVSLEGPKLGRHGIISWLSVSTSCCTFLFDIQALGKTAFDNGLREIFENSDIQKIFHDCREASDCLYHMFSCRLTNVFDTQVADKLVTMQKSREGKFDRYVDSLNSCLRNYLEVPEAFLYKPKPSQSYQDCVISFQLRPPQVELQDIMMKNVIYLRALKEKLEIELLNPFRRAVEVYLQVLQSATDRELLLEPSVPDKLPNELVMEGIQVVSFKDLPEMPPIVSSGPPYRETKNPVKEFLKCFNTTGIGKNGHAQNGSVTDLENHSVPYDSLHRSTGKKSGKSNVQLTKQKNILNTSNLKTNVAVSADSDNKMKESTSAISQKQLFEINKLPVNASKICEEKLENIILNREDSNKCKENNSAFLSNSILRDFLNPKLSISSPSDSESENSDSTIEPASNFSRQELDQQFLRECSKASSDEWNSESEISELSNEDDLWTHLRTEFSKSYDSEENFDLSKFRFVPAGMN